MLYRPMLIFYEEAVFKDVGSVIIGIKSNLLSQIYTKILIVVVLQLSVFLTWRFNVNVILTRCLCMPLLKMLISKRTCGRLVTKQQLSPL